MKKYERIVIFDSMLSLLFEQIQRNNEYKLVQLFQDKDSTNHEYYAVLEKEVEVNENETEQNERKNKTMLDDIFGGASRDPFKNI